MSDAPDVQRTVFDSGQQHVGTVYARALLGATEKAGLTAGVLAELDSLLDDVLRGLPQFHAILSSPRVPQPAKEQMLDRAFGGRMSPLLLNFLKVLGRHGRLDCLRAVRRAAHEQWDVLRGVLQVQVRTAEPLPPEMLDRVSARLRDVIGPALEIEPQVDPDLLGGLVVRVGDQLFDGSVALQLKRLRQRALEQTAANFRDAFTRFAD